MTPISFLTREDAVTFVQRALLHRAVVVRRYLFDEGRWLYASVFDALETAFGPPMTIIWHEDEFFVHNPDAPWRLGDRCFWFRDDETIAYFTLLVGPDALSVVGSDEVVI